MANRAASLVVESAQDRHPGGRAVQQDATAVLTSDDQRHCLAVVADGMGGHSGGQIAAEAVVATARALWQRAGAAPDDPVAFLATLCREADRAVEQRGGEVGARPRTTLVALLVSADHAYWLHVGDSRLYAFRRGRCCQRTKDHSVVEQLVRAGEIAPEDAASHPDQNLLLRCLGAGEGEGPAAACDDLALRPGDGFVLCSDGFWGVVAEREMAAMVDSAALGRAVTHWCLTAAERNGDGGDNVSVAVVRVARPGGGDRVGASWTVAASGLAAAVLAATWFFLI